MHTYRKNGKDEQALYTVGFELPSTESKFKNFRPIKDFDSEREAAAYTSYLNGGNTYILGGQS
jgi:hypothetical protein